MPYRLTGFLLRLLSPEADMVATNKLVVNRDKYPIAKAKGRATKYLDLE